MLELDNISPAQPWECLSSRAASFFFLPRQDVGWIFVLLLFGIQNRKVNNCKIKVPIQTLDWGLVSGHEYFPPLTVLSEQQQRNLKSVLHIYRF